MADGAPHGAYAAYGPAYVPYAYGARPPVFYAAPHQAGAAPPSARARAVQRVAAAAEQAWLQISSTAALLGLYERALGAADIVLAANPASGLAHVRMAEALHAMGQHAPAAEHFQKALSLPGAEALAHVWAALAHCYLMLEDLPRAFHAYQQALAAPGAAADGALWLGVGLLYDRYGADAHALEALGAALRTEGLRSDAPPSPVAREALLRAALLLRGRGRYAAAADALAYLCVFPPAPLRSPDVRVFAALTRLMAVDAAREAAECATLYAEGVQNGKLPDLEGEESSALEAVHAALRLAPGAMATVQAAWAVASRAGDATGAALLLQLASAAPKRGAEAAPARPEDALLFYYAGRAHMRRRAFSAAYEAYQEAVFRDGQNAAFWNSIGVLYLDIRQFRDALDAFSRAVHLAPGAWQLWWNLGVLYEQCNSQTADAADAYRRAAEHAGPALGAFIGRRLAALAAGPSPPPTRTFELDALAFVPRPVLPPRRT